MDKFYTWIASKLPKKLVYFCVVRAWIHSTTTPYDRTDLTQIRLITVLKRWEKDNEI